MAAVKSAAELILEAQQAQAGEDAGLEQGRQLVDSLPYCDQIDTALRSRADQLVKEELRTWPKQPSDYLAELPKEFEPNFEKFPMLAAEWERVGKSQALSCLDAERYELSEPESSSKKNVDAWTKSVNNASSQLEHQNLRIQNLELLSQHGGKVWKASNAQLESLHNRIKDHAEELENEVEVLNRERKLKQLSVGQQIHSLEQDWYAQIHKNMEVEAACKHIESQMAQSDKQ